MAKLLIKCERPYHSYIWPEAKPGDKRWGDENLMTKLTRDAGGGFFSILEVVSDRGEHIQTVHQPEAPKAEAPKPPKSPPKKKRATKKTAKKVE